MKSESQKSVDRVCRFNTQKFAGKTSRPRTGSVVVDPAREPTLDPCAGSPRDRSRGQSFEQRNAATTSGRSTTCRSLHRMAVVAAQAWLYRWRRARTPIAATRVVLLLYTVQYAHAPPRQSGPPARPVALQSVRHTRPDGGNRSARYELGSGCHSHALRVMCGALRRRALASPCWTRRRR